MRIPVLASVLAAMLLAAAAPARAQEASPAASPAAGVALERLLAVEFPAAVLPAQAQVAFGAAAWAPGAGMRHPAGGTYAGAGFDYVVAGAYAVRSDGPLLVVRAGGEREHPTLGAEVALGPGDAVVYLDTAAASAQRNAGAGELALLYAAVMALAAPAAGTPAVTGAVGGNALLPEAGWVMGFLGQEQWVDLAGGPLAATLERATVAPGASLPPPAGPGWRLAGAVGRYVGEQGRVTEPLANAGDEPLALAVLTLAPAAGAATPLPASSTDR